MLSILLSALLFWQIGFCCSHLDQSRRIPLFLHHRLHAVRRSSSFKTSHDEISKNSRAATTRSNTESYPYILDDNGRPLGVKMDKLPLQTTPHSGRKFHPTHPKSRRSRLSAIFQPWKRKRNVGLPVSFD